MKKTISPCVKCPSCGGALLIEYFRQCGHIHRINESGKIMRQFKKQEYESDDMFTMVYCQSCGNAITEQCEIITDKVFLKER